MPKSSRLVIAFVLASVASLPLNAFAVAQRPFCSLGQVSSTASFWCICTQAGANMMNNYYGGNEFTPGMMHDGSLEGQGDACSPAEAALCETCY